jgi:hypothetical protein
MTVQIQAGKFERPSSALNIASDITYSLTIDKVKPTVVLSADNTVDLDGGAGTVYSSALVNGTHFRDAFANKTLWMKATFSENIPDGTLAAGDFTLTRAAVSNITKISASLYKFQVVTSATTTLPTFSVQLKDAAVTDSAAPTANNSTASAVFTRTWDATAPTAPQITSTLNAANELKPVRYPSYVCSVKFNEPVTGFTVDKLSATNVAGQQINGVISGFSGSGATYSFTLTMAEGQASVWIPASVDIFDQAGWELATASNQFVRVLDSHAPTVAQVTSPLLGKAGFKNATIPVKVVFSEAMSGFVVGDLKVSGATIANFTTVSASTYTFNLLVTDPAAPANNGSTSTVSLVVPAASTIDTATNESAASTLITFNYNEASPEYDADGVEIDN